jgi:hypothetical protein
VAGPPAAGAVTQKPCSHISTYIDIFHDDVFVGCKSVVE